MVFVVVDSYLSPCAQRYLRQRLHERLEQEEPYKVWRDFEILNSLIGNLPICLESGIYRPDLWEGVWCEVVCDEVVYYRRAGDDVEVLAIGALNDDPNVRRILQMKKIEPVDSFLKR